MTEVTSLGDSMAATSTVLVLGVATGAALGWVYFTVLWASVRQLPERKPGAWFVVGLLARVAIAVTVLALIGRWGGVIGLLGALVGFISVRVVMLRRARVRGTTDETRP